METTNDDDTGLLIDWELYVGSLSTPAPTFPGFLAFRTVTSRAGGAWAPFFPFFPSSSSSPRGRTNELLRENVPAWAVPPVRPPVERNPVRRLMPPTALWRVRRARWSVGTVQHSTARASHSLGLIIQSMKPPMPRCLGDSGLEINPYSRCCGVIPCGST
jgi:hypothetical protein